MMIASCPRAAQAVKSANAARRDLTRHQQRTGVIARQLEQIAPGTVRVRTAPCGRRPTASAASARTSSSTAPPAPSKPTASSTAHAYNFLRRMFPGADWTRPLAYDARTGELTVDAPCAPAELGAVEGADQ
ncbi:hypothetical protein ACIP96_30480 [Streptomyces nigra]|uniref:hypothetical protein n=1 Tax=Streptomyces nigra TaxID=1827580 RepID=UPI003808732B